MRFARSRPTVVTCMADGSSLWRHTTTTTLGTRCRSAGAVHPINSNRDGKECPRPWENASEVWVDALCFPGPRAADRQTNWREQLERGDQALIAAISGSTPKIVIIRLPL